MRDGIFSTAGRLAQPEQAAGEHSAVYAWLYRLAVFTAFLTAFYTFRALFLTFYGPELIPPQAGHHAHESPPVMWIPLAVLAVCAFAVGFVFESGHAFAAFLGASPSLAVDALQHTTAPGEFHLHIAVASTSVSLAGIGLAAFLYLGHQREVEFISRLSWMRPLRQLSYRKFYVDEIYVALIVLPLRGAAWLSYFLDHWLVDGAVNLLGRFPLSIGNGLRRRQNGLVPYYSLAMAVCTLAMLVLSVFFWGRS